MCHWQHPALCVASVLTAFNVQLDQMLPHHSEAITGQSILIGRICLLYLHSPSSLNSAIDLGLGHAGLASWWWGVEGAEDTGGRDTHTGSRGVPWVSLVPISSYLAFDPGLLGSTHSMQRAHFQHLVNGCQYLQRGLVTTLQQKLESWNAMHHWLRSKAYSFTNIFSCIPFVKFVFKQKAVVREQMLRAAVLNVHSEYDGGISGGRLLLALFYSSALQSISDTTARAEPINHLLRPSETDSSFLMDWKSKSN